MLQLFVCCPRMNLLWFTLTTWKVERHSVLRTKAERLRFFDGVAESHYPPLQLKPHSLGNSH